MKEQTSKPKIKTSNNKNLNDLLHSLLPLESNILPI